MRLSGFKLGTMIAAGFAIANAMAALAQTPSPFMQTFTDECTARDHSRMDPTIDQKWSQPPPFGADYSIHHWFEHGLEKTLRDHPTITKLSWHVTQCVDKKKRWQCRLNKVLDLKKSDAKALKKITDAHQAGKPLDKLIKKALKRLPERLSDEHLYAWTDFRGTCGFSPAMLARAVPYKEAQNREKLAAGTQEQLSQQKLCEMASDNYKRAETTRPDTLYYAEKEWHADYTAGLQQGEFCAVPPLSLVNDTPMSGGDPLGDMPLDDYGGRHFHSLARYTPVNADNPSVTDCQKADSAGSMMVRAGHAAYRPDEAKWVENYRAGLRNDQGQPSYGQCDPLPPRLAAWASEAVQYSGWVWLLDLTEKIDREDCKYAVWNLPSDSMGEEFKRWHLTNLKKMSISYKDHRSSLDCTRVPKSFAAELHAQIQKSKSDAEWARLQAERRQQEYAANNPPEPTLQELLEEFNKNYRPPVILEERCYINQYGREHCYTR